MKEEIQITISNSKKLLSLKKGESLFAWLRKSGLFHGEFCGGIGKCGRCKVRFLENAPLPMPSERRLLTPEELRSGLRLACVTKPVADCEIELCFPEEKKMFVLDRLLENRGMNGEASFDFGSPCRCEKDEMVIADIGTTTIAMLLVEKGSGQIKASYHQLNPQRKYGSDVISRIGAGMSGESSELSKLVREVLLQGLKELGGDPQFMAAAGNTGMIYLLMEKPLEGLAKAPFTAANREEIVTQSGGLTTYIMPGISAFVGGDISAGIYALLMQMQEDRKKRLADEKSIPDETILLLDLGTNGEMALLTPKEIYVTATAAGPAFEGRTGLWGRDMVSFLADLMQNGLIDRYGTLKEPFFSDGLRVKEVRITQEDIRALQLAKAAVRTGIEILCKQAGCRYDEIDRVCLAGGFGYLIDPQKAGQIGLLPKELAGKAEAVGNTALTGLFLKYREYGKAGMECSLTHDLSRRERICDRIQNAKVFNLAECPEFNENYVKHMNLGE